MEKTESGSTQSDGAAGPKRQLPGDTGKMERLARETRGLIDDMKDWVDLKIRLVQIEMEERIEQKLNQALLGVILAVVVFLAVVFALTALALGLGSWLGHEGWGFLAVTGVLVLAAAALHMLKPRMVRVREGASAVKEEKTPPPASLTKTGP